MDERLLVASLWVWLWWGSCLCVSYPKISANTMVWRRDTFTFFVAGLPSEIRREGRGGGGEVWDWAVGLDLLR